MRLFRSVVGASAMTVAAYYGYVHYTPHGIDQVGLIPFIRYGRVVRMAATNALDYKLSLLFSDIESSKYLDDLSTIHTRCAKRLLNMCLLNKGAFIKLGQIVGALHHLVPKEYVDVMSILHEHAPITPLNEIFQVIEKDLNVQVGDLFSKFDDQPLGTASLAQVHRAVLRSTNEVVAVKVKHPHIDKYLNKDLDMMETLTILLAKIFPDFKLGFLAKQVKKKIPAELDFRTEAGNCEKVAQLMKGITYLQVPEVHRDMSTERVLVMSYCPGGKIDDLSYFKQNNIDAEEVATKLGTVYSQLIFKHGFVHCDPHPGNIKVYRSNGKTKLVLLDNALYQGYDDEFRYHYARLWLAIIKGNVREIEHTSAFFNASHLPELFSILITGRSWKAIGKGLQNERITKEELDEIRENAPKYLSSMADLMSKIPPDLLLLLRVNRLMEGIEHSLGVRNRLLAFVPISDACIRHKHRYERHTFKHSYSPLTQLFLLSNILQEQFSLIAIHLLSFIAKFLFKLESFHNSTFV